MRYFILLFFFLGIFSIEQTFAQTPKLIFCKWSGVGTPTTNSSSCIYMIHTTSDTVWYWNGSLWEVKQPVTGSVGLVGALMDTTTTLKLNMSNSTAFSVPIVYGIFTDDDAAALGGVPVGGMYRISFANPYGMPYGSIRIRNF